jgi:hypothetical protein
MQLDFDILATIARRLFTDSRATAIDHLGRRVVFSSPLESIRHFLAAEVSSEMSGDRERER